MQSGETNVLTTISYLRVSTNQQDAANQRAAILALANEKGLGRVHFVEETQSGKINWRQRAIGVIVDKAEPGDVVIVSELSRLGRSMLEIMEILSIATQKGLRLYAVKGSWSLDGSLQSKVVAMAFAIAAEIERDLISQRTREALAARKAAGFSLGRPRGVGKSKLDQHEVEIRALLANGSSQRFIARRYGTSESNLKRWMIAHKIKRAH